MSHTPKLFLSWYNQRYTVMLYNPFEQLTRSNFQDLLEQGYRDFVLQRFEWPDLNKGSGFMLLPYWTAEEAHAHAAELGPKEGKAIRIPADARSIQQMLEVNSGYRIFINLFREEKWNKRMLRMYEGKIINYLRSNTTFKRKNPIDILFTLEHGRVWAVITDGNTQKKVRAIELIA
ncbi:hypothetical protein ACFX5U_09540 [Sphingobacterium sp. SG20118]|uniref:hypothetical protein n=1 Tax=Sphingobacterium sp. SG20118 TaxID=3367156 RepID=UPI0037DFBF93